MLPGLGALLALGMGRRGSAIWLRACWDGQIRWDSTVLHQVLWLLQAQQCGTACIARPSQVQAENESWWAEVLYLRVPVKCKQRISHGGQ